MAPRALTPPLAEGACGPVQLTVPVDGARPRVVPPDNDPPQDGVAVDMGVTTLATRRDPRVTGSCRRKQDTAPVAAAEVPCFRRRRAGVLRG